METNSLPSQPSCPPQLGTDSHGLFPTHAAMLTDLSFDTVSVCFVDHVLCQKDIREKGIPNGGDEWMLGFMVELTHVRIISAFQKQN